METDLKLFGNRHYLSNGSTCPKKNLIAKKEEKWEIYSTRLVRPVISISVIGLIDSRKQAVSYALITTHIAK